MVYRLNTDGKHSKDKHAHYLCGDRRGFLIVIASASAGQIAASHMITEHHIIFRRERSSTASNAVGVLLFIT